MVDDHNDDAPLDLTRILKNAQKDANEGGHPWVTQTNAGRQRREEEALRQEDQRVMEHIREQLEELGDNPEKAEEIQGLRSRLEALEKKYSPSSAPHRG